MSESGLGGPDSGSVASDKDSSVRKYRDKEWLYQKYVVEEKTVPSMCEEIGCSRTAIYDWLRKHDIPRDRGPGYRPNNPEKYRGKEWLQEKYVNEELSTAQIADICDCSKACINRWLHRHDIPIRDRSESAKIRFETYPELAKKLVEAGTEALIELETNAWDEWDEEQREAFRQRLSEERTGEGNPMYGVTGPDHPHWKEDKPNHQFYQSKAWREVREEALERAGYECEVCASEDQLLGHHIIPLSDDGAPLDLDNVCILCRSCHGKWEGLYLRPDSR